MHIGKGLPIRDRGDGSRHLCDESRKIFITGLAKMHWCFQSNGLSAMFPPRRLDRTGKSRAEPMAADPHQESTFLLYRGASNLVSTREASVSTAGMESIH